MKRISPLLPLPAILLACSAVPALAQGTARAATASSGSTVVTVSPAMPLVINAVGSGIGAELARGSLRAESGAIPVEVQHRLLGILKGGDGAPELARALGARGVEKKLAGRLATSLTGLFDSPSPEQYREAMVALEALLASQPSEFRRDPPAEFVAVHEVLTRLASAVASAPPPF